MNTYALPKDSKAWQNAIDRVAHLLPMGSIGSIQALKQLPVFAIIVVVAKTAVDELTVNGCQVDDVVQAWTKTQRGWQAVVVFDDDASLANAHLVGTHESLTEVAVYRYLLIPTDHKEMSADKREAVAHIIDQQLPI